MKTHVLYNPMANGGKGFEDTKKIEDYIGSEGIVYEDITKIEDKDTFINNIPSDEKVIISGGDGTLNYYVNHTSEETRKKPIGYFASGTGNDFLRDLPEVPGNYVEDVSEFLVGLPSVTVNGKEHLFLNGVGFGIDGYCCEVGDELRAKSDKPINYTAIAIKGLLFYFKPRTATVTIDGDTRIIKYAWIVPAMYGRYYGGGMMATPGQDRRAEKKTLSTMIFHCKSALHALIVFPKIFSGDHIGNKIVDVMSGSEISVKFDKPCALQIDGETILNVSEYTARISK